MSFWPWYRSAPAIRSSVSSGISSISPRVRTWASTFLRLLPIFRYGSETGPRAALRELRAEAALFFVIGLPHREHVPIVATRRPHHDHHAALQQTHCDEPLFAIVEPSVLHLELWTGKNLIRIGEIQPT